MKTLRHWLKLSSRFVSHGILIGIPVVAIIGVVFPWPPAEESFSRLSGPAHVFVGMKISYVRLSERVVRTESRSYILMPPTFGWPRLVTVSQTEQELPTLSAPSGIKFLAWLGTYLFAVYVVWQTWFGRRPRPVSTAESAAGASRLGEVH